MVKCFSIYKDALQILFFWQSNIEKKKKKKKTRKQGQRGTEASVGEDLAFKFLASRPSLFEKAPLCVVVAEAAVTPLQHCNTWSARTASFFFLFEVQDYTHLSFEAPANICFFSCTVYYLEKKKKKKKQTEKKLNKTVISERTHDDEKKKIQKKEQGNKITSKTPSVWPITAYCTKFGYILLEWHGFAAQRVAAEHREFLCSFCIFYNVFFFFFQSWLLLLSLLPSFCVGRSPMLKATLIPGSRTS